MMGENTMKKCSTCDKNKRLSDFAIERRHKDGRRSSCKRCIKDYNKLYSSNNKDKIISYHKQWCRNNEAHIINYRRQYYKNNNTRINARNKTRKQSNPQYKIKCNLRTHLHSALQGNYKKGSAIELLGCSVDKFKLYLESKFQPGMNWENYDKAGWHIDHIKPLSSFDLTNIKQLKRACHHTNLQPLWAKDNLSKGSKFFDYKDS
jgi:Prasinovirus endonuclease VII